MWNHYTVGKYLVDRLSELGLEHLFSIAGDYSIEWVNNYVEKSPITVIEEVSELCAGYAADGYARLKGIGALCVTYSAGSLSAVNPIAGAYVERVPVVLINGTPNIKRTLTFEQTGLSAHHFISGRQTDLQVFEYITTAAVRIDNPDLAPMLIDYALTQCITEKRPVYIELLQDMVDLECDSPKGKLKPASTMSDKDSLAKAITQIKTALEGAARPIIWVGPEVDRFDLKDKTQKLIRQLNIPFVTELLSKAVLSEDDPQFAGTFDGLSSSDEVQTLVKNADFILALGIWLTDLNCLGWDPDYAKTAFVSLDTVKFGTSFIPQVSLDGLIDGLIKTNPSCKATDLPKKQPAKQNQTNLTDQITYDGFYDFIPQFIDKDTILGSDASMNYFGAILLKVGGSGTFIAQASYSSIGYISPAATGFCLAKKDHRRVMVFSGDGGFQMSAQCLSTQTRFKLNPIIFIINNGVYAVEQWLADPTVFEEPKNPSDPPKPFYNSCELQPWNYSKLADVFGCQGWKVTNYGQLKDAVETAKVNRDTPSIIQVVIDAKSEPLKAKWKKT